MSETSIQPQEIDSLITVLNRQGATLQLAVIPRRLIEQQNANGKMKNDLINDDCTLRDELRPHQEPERDLPTSTCMDACAAEARVVQHLLEKVKKKKT
ncbi:MAG: hypothetical protein V1799_20535 [bacterium]